MAQGNGGVFCTGGLHCTGGTGVNGLIMHDYLCSRVFDIEISFLC